MGDQCYEKSSVWPTIQPLEMLASSWGYNPEDATEAHLFFFSSQKHILMRIKKGM